MSMGLSPSIIVSPSAPWLHAWPIGYRAPGQQASRPAGHEQATGRPQAGRRPQAAGSRQQATAVQGCAVGYRAVRWAADHGPRATDLKP